MIEVKLVNINLNRDTEIQKMQRLSFGDVNQERQKHTDRDLLKILWNQNHKSVFEFLQFIFFIKCPIYVQRQIFRYRTQSYIEQSLRRQVPDFDEIFPDHLISYIDTNKKDENENVLSYDVRKTMENVYNLYKELIDSGIPKEKQRQILPLQTLTKFYWRIDQRNLYHFLEERLQKSQQQETRQLQKMILELLNNEQTQNLYEIFVENLKLKLGQI